MKKKNIVISTFLTLIFCLTLVLGACGVKSYSVEAPSVTGYSITPIEDKEKIKEGESYSFKVELHDGYIAPALAVKANGVEIVPVDGIYTVDNIKENVVLTVYGVQKYENKIFAPVQQPTEQVEYSDQINTKLGTIFNFIGIIQNKQLQVPEELPSMLSAFGVQESTIDNLIAAINSVNIIDIINLVSGITNNLPIAKSNIEFLMPTVKTFLDAVGPDQAALVIYNFALPYLTSEEGSAPLDYSESDIAEILTIEPSNYQTVQDVIDKAVEIYGYYGPKLEAVRGEFTNEFLDNTLTQENITYLMRFIFDQLNRVVTDINLDNLTYLINFIKAENLDMEDLTETEIAAWETLFEVDIIEKFGDFISNALNSAYMDKDTYNRFVPSIEKLINFAFTQIYFEDEYYDFDSENSNETYLYFLTEFDVIYYDVDSYKLVSPETAKAFLEEFAAKAAALNELNPETFDIEDYFEAIPELELITEILISDNSWETLTLIKNTVAMIADELDEFRFGYIMSLEGFEEAYVHILYYLNQAYNEIPAAKRTAFTDSYDFIIELLEIPSETEPAPLPQPEPAD